jgi:hypothetical protein
VDLFDDEAEQGLFLVEVECVDHGQDPAGEVTDAAAQLVVAGEPVDRPESGSEPGRSPPHRRTFPDRNGRCYRAR